MRYIFEVVDNLGNLHQIEDFNENFARGLKTDLDNRKAEGSEHKHIVVTIFDNDNSECRKIPIGKILIDQDDTFSITFADSVQKDEDLQRLENVIKTQLEAKNLQYLEQPKTEVRYLLDVDGTLVLHNDYINTALIEALRTFKINSGDLFTSHNMYGSRGAIRSGTKTRMELCQHLKRSFSLFIDRIIVKYDDFYGLNGYNKRFLEPFEELKIAWENKKQQNLVNGQQLTDEKEAQLWLEFDKEKGLNELCEKFDREYNPQPPSEEYIKIEKLYNRSSAGKWLTYNMLTYNDTPDTAYVFFDDDFDCLEAVRKANEIQEQERKKEKRKLVTIPATLGTLEKRSKTQKTKEMYMYEIWLGLRNIPNLVESQRQALEQYDTCQQIKSLKINDPELKPLLESLIQEFEEKTKGQSEEYKKALENEVIVPTLGILLKHNNNSLEKEDVDDYVKKARELKKQERTKFFAEKMVKICMALSFTVVCAIVTVPFLFYKYRQNTVVSRKMNSIIRSDFLYDVPKPA